MKFCIVKNQSSRDRSTRDQPNDHDCTILLPRLLFCQSIRRVNCVIGRTERREVAYIAREPSGQVYRRLCHLFRTKSSHQVWTFHFFLMN
uniref:PID domain-containing protein n=1 Tax=Elaeophora elaphi TaxID=1147741 RepID=A0A0R3RKU7_9BILA